MTDILMPKNAKDFYCEFCDFKCSKQSNYDAHLFTRKHKKTYKMLHHNNTNDSNVSHLCICGKTYNHRQSLYKHRLKCKQHNSNSNEGEDKDKDKDTFTPISGLSDLDDKALIKTLLIQIPDLVKSIIEISKDKQSHNYSHNNHSLNKTFNLQFFLNETCKDAMNISEFVSSIKPQLIDLEDTGRLGYVEGVSNIILNNLKTLQIHDRPIHCSDQKREVIYIKDNNEWTKEDEDKPILTKAIKVIANENIKNINQWTKEHPNCTKADSKKNDLYLQIVSNSMSGGTKAETNKNINKIISNIAKEVVIDKINTTIY